MPEAPPSRTLTQEMMLLDVAKRLEKYRIGRVALHIHLSDLVSSYKRNQYIRIATETFTASLANFEGQLFTLENNDLVFVARDTTAEMLEPAVNRLRVLFSEDPLVQFQAPQEEQQAFCTWYNLETDYEAFLQATQKILQQAEDLREDPDFYPGYDRSKLISPIRPELLARLEQALNQTDVSNVVRRQTVCTLIEHQPPQPLFEEIFVSIEDLQSIATPGIDLLSNRWLFQYLTQTLDKRVMSMLIRDGINSARPFSLNLNVATVLSTDFARFEAIITPQLRGRLVIEMNKLDVFSDMGAFLFARDYLHDRGFRICLDGLTHHTLPYYDRTRLGFDLIKIYWTPDSLDGMLEERIPDLRSVVMDAGQARTILCRCENEQAIELGQSLGIVMFQGRHVARMLGSSRLSTLSPAQL